MNEKGENKKKRQVRDKRKDLCLGKCDAQSFAGTRSEVEVLTTTHKGLEG